MFLYTNQSEITSFRLSQEAEYILEMKLPAHNIIDLTIASVDEPKRPDKLHRNPNSSLRITACSLTLH